MIFRLLAVMFAGCAALSAEPMTVDGLPQPIELSLPDKHDPAKSWPAVFFYHGTGGHPTTHMIRQHTGTKNWIVVGMGYTKPGPFTYTPENLQRELMIFRRVRDQLAKTKGLDPKRLYVSGFSMGGWMSGLFLQAEPSLAGAAILGGGHMHEVTPKRKALPPQTPVFLGVGRNDGVYPFALKAKLFFGSFGADVRMETWEGLGHEFPKDGSPGLKEWFTLRAGGTPDNDAITKDYQRITGLASLEQWQALLEFRERPFVTVPGQTWPETIKTKLAELEKDPAVEPEAKVYRRHRQLLASEVKAITLPDLEKVGEAYSVLVLEAGNSSQTGLIAADKKRVDGLLKSFRAQSAERKQQAKPIQVDPPKDDRRIPRNPMVR